MVARELHVVALFQIFGAQTHHNLVAVHAVVLGSQSHLQEVKHQLRIYVLRSFD